MWSQLCKTSKLRALFSKRLRPGKERWEKQIPLRTQDSLTHILAVVDRNPGVEIAEVMGPKTLRMETEIKLGP